MVVYNINIMIMLMSFPQVLSRITSHCSHPVEDKTKIRQVKRELLSSFSSVSINFSFPDTGDARDSTSRWSRWRADPSARSSWSWSASPTLPPSPVITPGQFCSGFILLLFELLDILTGTLHVIIMEEKLR